MKGWALKLFSTATRGSLFTQLTRFLEKMPEGDSPMLRVLTYHRIGYPDQHPDLYPGLISADPNNFELQMAHLAAYYHPISVQELLDVYDSGHKLPKRAVLVTFDDAYMDFEEHAWPTLKCHGIPAALFVPTAFPDQHDRVFWWDHLYLILRHASDLELINTPLGRLPVDKERNLLSSYKQLAKFFKSLPLETTRTLVQELAYQVEAPAPNTAVLSWDVLRRLAREGVTLGAHTRFHPVLNHATLKEVEAEVAGSLTDLEHEIGPVPRIFAYPAGGVNEAVVQILINLDVRIAFSTKRGINNLKSGNRLNLKRINVGQASSLSVFGVQLSSAHAYLSR